METAGQVTLAEMLCARERRAVLQRELLVSGETLICLTMNIPGPVKTSRLIEGAFFEGMRRIEALSGKIRRMKLIREKTGFEVYYLTDADAVSVKKAVRTIEETPLIGRIFDIDVILPSGEKLSGEALGFPARSCLLCEKPAFLCARSRAHSVEDMFSEITRRIRAFNAAEAEIIGRAAVRALHTEAETTPKPGLVDRRNNGSHPDMDLALLKKSADALEDYFTACAQTGMEFSDAGEIFPPLQAAGLEAERRMLEATGGVNTHKGAIFTLGLLCAAAGHLRFRDTLTVESICRTAEVIASEAVQTHFENLTRDNVVTFGEKLYLQTGIRGIRGEAADGFPSILNAALPCLEGRLAEGMSMNDACVRTLLSLLAQVDDTTLIRRGGTEIVAPVREAAKALLNADDAAIEALDDEFIRRNLTCGGCADLLAGACFLHAYAELFR